MAKKKTKAKKIGLHTKTKSKTNTMAKSRKHRKVARKHHRRSRGSMMGAIDTTNILGVALGAVAAKFVDKIIPETVDAKIVAGGKIALGVALPMFVKSGKAKDILAGVGSGMLAVGTVELLTSFGVLSGVGANDDDMLVVSLEGVDDINVINGVDDIRVINGIDTETVLAGDNTETVLGDMDVSEIAGMGEEEEDQDY